MEIEHKLAFLNDVIYRDPSQWREELDKVNMQDYHIDSLSKPNTMIVSNHKTKNMYVIHSGTDLQRRAAEDLFTDAFISFDMTKQSPRYHESKKITKEAIDKYDGYNHIVSGFSLGGAMSNSIGQELDIASYSFNPGVSPLNLQRNLKPDIFGQKKNEKHRIFLVEKDWISNSAFLNKKEDVKIQKKKDGKKAHSIDNFYNLATS